MGTAQMDRSPRTATRDYDRDMDDSDDDLALDYSPEAALYTRGADGIALSPRGPQAARRPDDDDNDDNEKGGLSVYVTIHRYGLRGTGWWGAASGRQHHADTKTLLGYGGC
jgi:hypothetical protein